MSKYKFIPSLKLHKNKPTETLGYIIKRGKVDIGEIKSLDKANRITNLLNAFEPVPPGKEQEFMDIVMRQPCLFLNRYGRGLEPCGKCDMCKLRLIVKLKSIEKPGG